MPSPLIFRIQAILSMPSFPLFSPMSIPAPISSIPLPAPVPMTPMPGLLRFF